MTRHIIKKAGMEFNTKRRVRKRISWLREDVDKLFDIWGKYLRELGLSRRNSHVYEKMSDEMKRVGVNVSSGELRVKINNVTQIWRREKRLAITLGKPSEWDLFDTVDKLLASNKSLRLTSTYYVGDSSSHEDLEELQSISSDFEMTKDELVKKYNGKTSLYDQNDDIEKMLKQIGAMGSSSHSQPEFVAVKNELDVDGASNSSTPLPSGHNQNLANKDKENSLETHKLKQSEQSVSSRNIERTNKEPLNPINRDDDDDDDEYEPPRRTKLFRLKKMDSKQRASDGIRKNVLNKETLFNLKQEKLSLEIEHLRKINCKVDLQIEKARLENRLLSLKVKRYQRSYPLFS